MSLRSNYKKQVENNTELENKNQELNKHHMYSTTFEVWYSGSGTKRYSSWGADLWWNLPTRDNNEISEYGYDILLAIQFPSANFRISMQAA